MKQLLFIGLLSLTTAQLTGQIQNVDSLVNVLETSTLTASEQLRLYSEICNQYVENDIEKSVKYAEEGLNVAEKEKDRERASVFLNHLGIAYYTKSSYDTALVYLQKALSLAVEIDDKEQEAIVYVSMGNLHRRQTNYDEAINSYTKSMEIAEKTGDKNNHALALINISAIYRLMGNDEKSIYYLEEAVAISKELNLPYLEMSISYNLGGAYKNLSQLDKALENAKRTIEISQSINEVKYEIGGFYLLASIYEELNDYDKAHDNAKKCVQLAEEYGDSRLLMGSIIGLSSLYLNMENYNECEALSLKAWNIDSTDLVYAKDAAYYLILSYIQKGDKEQANYFFSKYNEIIAERDVKQYRDALADMEVKYETEKKEIRIASLEKERRLYLWLGIVGVLLIVSMALVLWQNIRNIRKERRLIASEAIQEGEIGERARIAKDLHDRLGGSLSAVKIGLKNLENIQSIGEKLDACIKEVREITNNVMPRSLHLYGMRVALEDFSSQFSNLHFHFFGDDVRIKHNLEYTVYCCARELVNNALKHSGASAVNLQLIQGKKHISLTVQDDGCGFDEKTVIKGDGLQNIRNRIASCRGKMDVVSSPGKGTETVIELRVES